jgi:hypothetical protein
MSFDTFSGVSARLRERNLASDQEIDQTLEHLRTRSFGQPIELEHVVHGTTLTEQVAERILDAIVDDDLETLLEKRPGIKCPECGTVEHAELVHAARDRGESYFCTEDAVDLADPATNPPEIPVYYLLT